MFFLYGKLKDEDKYELIESSSDIYILRKIANCLATLKKLTAYPILEIRTEKGTVVSTYVKI